MKKDPSIDKLPQVNNPFWSCKICRDVNYHVIGSGNQIKLPYEKRL